MLKSFFLTPGGRFKFHFAYNFKPFGRNFSVTVQNVVIPRRNIKK